MKKKQGSEEVRKIEDQNANVPIQLNHSEISGKTDGVKRKWSIILKSMGDLAALLVLNIRIGYKIIEPYKLKGRPSNYRTRPAQEPTLGRSGKAAYKLKTITCEMERQCSLV